jgi:coproporphyrinogen III oxidase-like Fe-S oxidoreductase
MLALRTTKGLELAKYNQLFHTDFCKEYADVLKKDADVLEMENGFLRIKPDYLFVQNTIIVDFFSEE